MTEEQWAKERADVIDANVDSNVSGGQAAFGDGREEDHLPAAKRLLNESARRLPEYPTPRNKQE
jgi:hypothetical protein